jgi:pimeloyl-ACP methyl ester carboxylesterase
MRAIEPQGAAGPAAPCVVLLHSSTGSARQWSGLAEALAPRFRVHAIDFHGHGQRPDWGGPMPLCLADEVALVEPVLRAAAGGVHVVGHSYGGAVALKLAALHPHALRSLVVYEPVLFGWLRDDEPPTPALEQIVAVADTLRVLLAGGRAQAAAERFIDFWSGAGSWAALPAGRREAIAARMPAVRQHFEALFGEPLRGAGLARVDLPPTLCLSGQRSVATTQRIAALLRRWLPGAQHEVLPAMGHMGPVTHADEVNHRIVAFLQAQLEAAPALAA